MTWGGLTYFCNSNGYLWLGSPEWVGTPPQTSCPAVDAIKYSFQCFYLPGWLFSLEWERDCTLSRSGNILSTKLRSNILYLWMGHTCLTAEACTPDWLPYLLLYWTPLAKRLCKLWFIDCMPAGMFLSLSCPGSDPTSFLSAENILTRLHELVQ